MELTRPAIPGGIIATSHKSIPTNLSKKNFTLSSRGLRKAIEHLPSLNTRRLRLEKYVFLFIFFTVK